MATLLSVFQTLGWVMLGAFLGVTLMSILAVASRG